MVLLLLQMLILELIRNAWFLLLRAFQCAGAASGQLTEHGASWLQAYALALAHLYVAAASFVSIAKVQASRFEEQRASCM